MKKILLSAALLLFAPAVYAAPLLSEDDQYELLKSIDDICGDTWCEGDSNWSFDAIDCDSEDGCSLSLTMKPYEFDDEMTLPERNLSCDLYTFTNRDSLVEITNRGLQYTPELFTAVGDCIDSLTNDFGPMWIPIDTSCRSLFPSDENAILNIDLKDDLYGLDAALWSVTRLIRNQAKIDSSCKLETIPTFRDQANCRSTASAKTCSFQSEEGWFRVRVTKETESAEVRYYPKKAS